VYSLGSAIYTATIPVGGNVLTSDISLGLKTTLSEAEDVKKRLGATTRDERFDVRTLDGRATREHTTAELRQIVVPRVLETLRMARQKIVENVPRDVVLGEVVLTGGGAQLPGIEAIAEEVFGLPVRTGTPNTIGGLTDAMAAPQYATAVGLVLFGSNGEREDALRNGRRGSAVLHRVQRWLSDLWA
jgi:cell division protein FtsA